MQQWICYIVSLLTSSETIEFKTPPFTGEGAKPLQDETHGPK